MICDAFNQKIITAWGGVNCTIEKDLKPIEQFQVFWV